MNAAAPLIRLARIRFRRNGRTILQDIDMSVCAGEIVTLIGPNGAGKSALVEIALGLQQPDSGTVERRPRLSCGYVPQKIDIDPAMPLTVRRFLQLERSRPRAAPAHALAQAGAPHDALLNAPMQSISGGEMRRVLLARALLREPDLLILDEPSAGMDLGGQAELYRLIQTLRERRRCGVLLVSHDLHMVMASTDRVFCLNRHLCCSGRPESVRRHPQFLALFGAHAASGLAVYQHHHDHAHTLHGGIEPARDGAEGHAADAAPHAAGAAPGDAAPHADSAPGSTADPAAPRRPHRNG